MKKSCLFHYSPHIYKPLQTLPKSGIEGLRREAFCKSAICRNRGCEFCSATTSEMEQKKISSSYENKDNNNNNNNNSNMAIRDEDGYKGVPIHSQVMKVKQEFEKIKHPSLQQPEMRRVLREITRQRSRSPLGLAERPISVGNS